MKYFTTGIPGVVVFEPTPVRDDRGFFTRTFDIAIASEAGLDPTSFKQENQSRSTLGGVRGLHGRLGVGEAKLVRCSYGAVLDVVVDARPGSPTFGTIETFMLDDVEHRQVYVPGGCLHGYQALTPTADFCYKSDRFYGPGEIGVDPLDKELAIPWQEPIGRLSERDSTSPTWQEFVQSTLGISSAPRRPGQDLA